MNKNLQLHFQAAKHLKIPAYYDSELGYLQLSFRDKKYFFLEDILCVSPTSSILITIRKNRLSQILEQEQIPCHTHSSLPPNLRTYKILLFNHKIQHVLEYSNINEKSLPDLRTLGKRIPSFNQKILIHISKLTGSELISIDIACEDIQRPFHSIQWFVLEANVGKDLYLHESTALGKKLNISVKILRKLIFRHFFSYCYERWITSNQKALAYPEGSNEFKS